VNVLSLCREGEHDAEMRMAHGKQALILFAIGKLRYEVTNARDFLYRNFRDPVESLDWSKLSTLRFHPFIEIRICRPRPCTTTASARKGFRTARRNAKQRRTRLRTFYARRAGKLHENLVFR
jgi:hypothetical protein